MFTFLGGGSVALNAATLTTSGTNESRLNTPGGVKMTGDYINVAASTFITANGVNNALVSMDAANIVTLFGSIVADASAGGRLVSVLEGGYDLEGLANSVAAHVAALMQVK